MAPWYSYKSNYWHMASLVRGESQETQEGTGGNKGSRDNS